MPLVGEFSRRINELRSASAWRLRSHARDAADDRPMSSRLRQAVASIQLNHRATDANPHDRLNQVREFGARRLGQANEDL